MSDALPPLTAASTLSQWRLDPVVLALAVALLVGYLALVRRAGARGHRWPAWRTLVFAALGPGTLVVATMSFLALYREALFWPAATANTVLLTVTPMGLALGAPLRLARSVLSNEMAGQGRPGSGWRAGPTGRLGSLPLLGALLGLAVQFALYFTPWFAASLRSGGVRTATSVVLLAVGALFTVPLLDEGDSVPAPAAGPPPPAIPVGSVARRDGEPQIPQVLREGEGEGPGEEARQEVTGPSWGARVLLAFGDGLLDAVPGMVVALSGAVVAGGWYVTRTPSWWGPGTAYDQLLGGELMVGVAEVVGVPLILAACIAWSRSDTARAAAIDAELDERERAEAPRAAAPSSETVPPSPALDAGGKPLPEGRVRPWWETERRP